MNEKSSINLIPAVFKVLFDEILYKLASKYDIKPDLMSEYQLFGYSNFDENSPSIKKLVYDETKIWINGKYLYNKLKQYEAGENSIMLSREYTTVFFQVIGYRDFNDFITTSPQLEDYMLQQQTSKMVIHKEEDQHFIGYYLGENNDVIPCYFRVYNNRRSAEWRLYYWEESEKVKEYKYFGKVNQRQDSISIYFSQDDATLARSAFIAMYYDLSMIFKPILNGCYSGFDKSMRPVCGEILFLRQEEGFSPNPEELRNINPIYIQYLTHKRIVTESKFSETPYDLSAQSKFAFQLNELVGSYGGMIVEESTLKPHFALLEIDSNILNCTIQTNINIYRGYFKPLSNGIIEGEFFSSSKDEKLSVYLKAQTDNNGILSGKISGFSKFMQIMSGDVFFSSQQEHIDKVKSQSKLNKADQNPEILSTLLNQVSKQWSKTSSNNQIQLLVGKYSIYLSENQNEARLEIKDDSSVIIDNEPFTYTGQAELYGFSILAINLDRMNDEPSPGQLLFFVGRVKGEKIKLGSGIWQHLDELGRPKCSKVLFSHEKHTHSSEESFIEIEAPYSIVTENQLRMSTYD